VGAQTGTEAQVRKIKKECFTKCFTNCAFCMCGAVAAVAWVKFLLHCLLLLLCANAGVVLTVPQQWSQ
jgi:hypothetical protein